MALTAEQQEEQTRIIREGSGREAFRFARDTPGADIQALQRVVIDRGTGDHAYYFARDVAGADIQALQNVVIERGDGIDCASFVNDVRGADLAALQTAMIVRGDGWDVAEFGFRVKDAGKDVDVVGLQRAVLERGTPAMALAFANKVDGADISTLADMVLTRGDAEEVFILAKFYDDWIRQDKAKADLFLPYLPAVRSRLGSLKINGGDEGYLARFDAKYPDLAQKANEELIQFGLEVGRRVTLHGVKNATGTITDAIDIDHLRVEYDEPQQIDGPDGAAAKVFLCCRRNISSSWLEMKSGFSDDALMVSVGQSSGIQPK